MTASRPTESGSQPPATTLTYRVVANARAAGPAAGFPDHLQASLSAAGFAEAVSEISTWPDYSPTPIVKLPSLAASLGLSDILYKDEAGRFGLGSFKALGGAYAVARVLAAELASRGISQTVSTADLASGRYADLTRDITVTSATDGNHGRSVAWGARTFGCRAVIFIHSTVSEGRRAAIANYGADVIRVPGGYDDSVRHAFGQAAAHGWTVVQDTAAGDYREIPRDITYGYGVIAEEAVRTLSTPPTHVIVQAGVGGVASAICARFWQAWGADRPSFLILEPTRAACVTTSLANGHRTDITGDVDSVMAGLSCGEVSELAWEILATGADAAIAVDDSWAVEGMRRLANPLPGDPAVVGGECSGGAIGALLALTADADAAAALGLDRQARVLLIGTEGASDPEIYRTLVGRDPATVA